MQNVIAFPIGEIVWRAIEAEMKAEADRNRHLGSGYIRFFPQCHNRERIERQLHHIPRIELSAAMERLRPRIQEALAVTNEELHDSVYRRRLDRLRK